ncbi:hypothetical protein HY025_02790 [Candidatus Daviesbacteria bacterium]|nr:hypothetical protein [Candidatus Daviesbacteria bacterium]
MKLALTLPGFNDTAGTTNISPPSNFSKSFVDLATTVSGFLNVIFYVVTFLMFFWFLWGVFEYLFAEGQKETLYKARNRIRWALIGFIFVILAFAISKYAGELVPQQNVNVTNVTGK